MFCSVILTIVTTIYTGEKIFSACFVLEFQVQTQIIEAWSKDELKFENMKSQLLVKCVVQSKVRFEILNFKYLLEMANFLIRDFN